MSYNPLEAYLAENPRLMGAVFTLGLLLVEVGSVVADGGGGHNGP